MPAIDMVRLAEAVLFTTRPTDRALEGWMPAQSRMYARLPEAEMAEYITDSVPLLQEQDYFIEGGY